MDAYTLLPQHAGVYIEEGARKRTRETDFDRKTQPLARDALSAIYALRATLVGPGQKITLQVIENGDHLRRARRRGPDRVSARVDRVGTGVEGHR